MKVKLREIFIYFKNEFTENDITALGSQVAYSLIFSIFPFLIFLVTLLAFIHVDVNLLLGRLDEILPTQAYNIVSKTLTEVFTDRNTGLLSISIVGSIWSASGGVKAIMKSINNAYEVKETRNFLKLALESIIGVFILAVTILVLLGMIVFGDVIVNFLYNTFHIPHILLNVIIILKPVITLCVVILGFSVIYTYFPNKKVKWKETFIGSVVTTILLLIISIGFSFYVNNFSNYSNVYGSIGGVVVLLTWLFLTSISIIVGGEVNAYVMKLNEKEVVH